MIGIYALYWEQSDKVYIGQSVNIKNRFAQHLKSMESNSSNYKILEEFDKYGPPTLIILELCSIIDLDALERQYIIEFDSVNSGLNISKGGSCAVGVDNFASKYSKNTLLKVFSLLYSTQYSCREIALKLKVTTSIVSAISVGQRHIWLQEEYPDKYALMERNRSNKLKYSEYPVLINAAGEHFSITNVRDFCNTNVDLNLISSHISAVIRGTRKSHKGFMLAPGEVPRPANKPRGILLGPNNEEYLDVFNITEFCIDNEYLKELPHARKGISRVFNGESLSYKGFKLK